MQLRIHVTERDTEYMVTTNLGVIIEWERKFKRKASDLASGIGMEDLAFMAFRAAAQNGVTVPAIFDDYIKRIVNLEVLDDETPNPIQEAHTSAP